MKTVEKADAYQTNWEEKREAILDCATVLFAQRGPDGVSLREIGTLVGMHMSTLYHYFPDKASLYTSVVRRAWERAAAITISSASVSSTPKARLRHLLNSAIDFYADNTPEAKIVDRELLLGIDLDSGSLQHGLPSYSVLSTTILTQIIKEINPPATKYFDEQRLALIFYSTIHGTIRHRPIQQTLCPLERDPENTRLKRDIFILIEQIFGLPVGELST